DKKQSEKRRLDMNISTILNQKPVSGVAWITPDATVTDALALLADKGIGTLVVSQDGSKPDGILSERDIVRALARKGSMEMMSRVDSIMTDDPVTCTPEEDSSNVLGKMSQGRFRHMPVVDAGGALVGLVSIGDIVKARMTDLEYEHGVLVDMIAGR
ncbi:MAG: CBS domain-containing protein, partial [Pseudomonadota bacterium]